MSKGRLTRQELSWLLAQEAQNAAERLRVGVKVLRTQAPPPLDVVIHEDPSHHVDASLDALDDVMKMLSSLNQRQSSSHQAVPSRRGRIDMAALIVEVAPDARVSIEPGSGTEVYGDESDFRRMLQVLIGHGTGEGASVTVRRDGDDVRISTTLGPDSSPTAATERAWLSRMTVRYGGRHDFQGGNETLVLPAEAAAERSERDALRKELDEARAQGEVYARELAAVFERGEEVVALSSMPPASLSPSRLAAERFSSLTKVCAAVASELVLAVGQASHAAPARDLVGLLASLEAIRSLAVHELETEVDLVDVARAVARDLEAERAADARSSRATVLINVPAAARVYVRSRAKGTLALVRELVRHAVTASPKGSNVELTVVGAADGARFEVLAAAPSPFYLAAALADSIGADFSVEQGASAVQGEAGPSRPGATGARAILLFRKASLSD